MKVAIKHKLITDAVTLKEYVRVLHTDLTFFDTESEGLDRGSVLFGISIYDNKMNPCFVAIENKYYDGVPLADAQRILNPYLSKINGVAHNGKYDLWILQQYGFVDPKIVMDTMLAVQAYNPDLRKKLEVRLAEDLGWNKQTFEEIVRKKWDKIEWGEVSLLELLAKYSCEDVYGTKLLYDYYVPKLKEINTLRVIEEIEIPLSYVLRDMKERGVNIDVPLLHRLDEEMTAELEGIHQNVYREAGCIFNINSPKQKAEILYDKQGFECPKVTNKGGRSTDAEALEILAGEGSKLAEELLRHSEINKLLTTYVRGIPEKLDPDGRLRGDFNSEGARTGRMSSSNPNLQNQPNNSKYPVRKAFIPADGCVFGIADWSQIELRVMAHASMDENLVHAFMTGQDIHAFVANQLGITRKEAKTVNFGVIYGMGPDSLAKLLGISPTRAAKIIDGYHKRYHGYDLWKQKIQRFAKANGYVRNQFGRVRLLPDAQKGYGAPYAAAMRQAVNTYIQGTAADLMKKNLIEISRVIREKNLKAWPLMVVHDEFVVEIQKNVPGRFYHVEEAFTTIVDIMENFVKLRVPVVADGKICNNWFQMKDDNFLCLLQQEKMQNNLLLLQACNLI